MADYVYLLETRLSPSQQAALTTVREVARQGGLTVFLVGGAVRDLISGSPVRDLDFVLQGDALQLRDAFTAQGASYSGQSEAKQALYLRFSGGVRVEVGSALSATYAEPGKAAYAPTSILEDLRRRDFTANAMALSLNEGSYGLLMDPLNGVADIENRELRLVSNYGFLEDPVRMIRAARLMARLGWQMDERTRSRYETGKEENYIGALQAAERGYELEEIFHEEEPLRVMRRLEEEGWLARLSPTLAVGKANVGDLAKLRENQMQLQTQGVLADAAAANFPLLTAKLSAKESADLKASFPRVGFVEEIESLESQAKEFGARLLSKELASPSAAYKAILAAHPAAVLWLAYSTRSSTLQARFKSFLNEWPQAQTKIPYLLMAEMRITPELPAYASLLEDVVFAVMDGRVDTPEAMRSFLEPYSPPAPPPPVSLRRPRVPRKESKGTKSRKKQVVAEEGTVSEATEVAAAPAESTLQESERPVPHVKPALVVPETPAPPAAKTTGKSAPKAAATPAAKQAKAPVPVPKPAAVAAKAVKALKKSTRIQGSSVRASGSKAAGKALKAKEPSKTKTSGSLKVTAKAKSAKTGPPRPAAKKSVATKPAKKLAAKIPVARKPVAKKAAVKKSVRAAKPTKARR